MKKTLVIIGFLFLVGGCTSTPSTVPVNALFISHIPPEHFEAAHPELVVAEAFMELKNYSMAGVHYRKAWGATNTEVAYFEHLLAVAYEKSQYLSGALNIARSLARGDEKYPLPDFYQKQNQAMIDRLEPIVRKEQEQNRRGRTLEIDQTANESP